MYPYTRVYAKHARKVYTKGSSEQGLHFIYPKNANASTDVKELRT